MRYDLILRNCLYLVHPRFFFASPPSTLPLPPISPAPSPTSFAILFFYHRKDDFVRKLDATDSVKWPAGSSFIPKRTRYLRSRLRSREIYRCHGLRASQNFSCVYPAILVVRHVVLVREHVYK